MKKIALMIALMLSPLFGDSSPVGSVLSNANGRFVFGQISEYQKDKFMLDTKTGALWKMVRDYEDNSSILEPISYIQYINGKVKYDVVPPQSEGKK